MAFTAQHTLLATTLVVLVLLQGVVSWPPNRGQQGQGQRRRFNNPIFGGNGGFGQPQQRELGIFRVCLIEGPDVSCNQSTQCRTGYECRTSRVVDSHVIHTCQPTDQQQECTSDDDCTNFPNTVCDQWADHHQSFCLTRRQSFEHWYDSLTSWVYGGFSQWGGFNQEEQKTCLKACCDSEAAICDADGDEVDENDPFSDDNDDNEGGNDDNNENDADDETPNTTRDMESDMVTPPPGPERNNGGGLFGGNDGPVRFPRNPAQAP